jgi:phosphohistidine swiveling domain-containing protein
VREILDAAIYLYTMLQSGVVAAAVGAEGLFTGVYDKMIKRQGDPPAPAFLLGFDSTPILAEKALYDLAMWCRTRASLATYLADTPTQTLVAQLHSDLTPPDVEQDDWTEWQNRLRAHLQQYGHIIYDLDFAKPVPAEDPTPLIEVCKLYISGQGTDPHARQRATAECRQQATEAMLNKLKGLRLKIFRKLVGWAQTTAPLREDSIADLGLGYPLLRQMLLELGRRLVQASAIEQAADIFWLREPEIVQAAAALDKGEPVSRLAELVPQRKAVWRAERRVPPPPSLPVGQKFFGMDLEKIGPARVNDQTGDVLKGAGTSSGSVTAPACVLHGPEDFDQMKPGQVLVAAITTPAWTPLFAMASAVVTDIGGPLSHGSIVAREYGIPAVMGTGVATRRIKSGQMITVDGSAGTVTLAARSEPAASAPIEWKLPNPKGQYMRASVADFMPNPVSPLFETLSIPAIARVGVKEVLRPLTRSEPRLPDYILTINSYVYINGTYTLREWWWILTRMMLSMPRMLREAIPLWRDKIRPRYAATAARWQDSPLEVMPAAELWAGIQELNDAAMLHFASLLVATTGASAGAEMLFSGVYNKLIRRAGDPEVPVFLMGYDSTPIQAEKSLYDLAEWVRERPELAEYILSTPSADIAARFLDFPSGKESGVRAWPNFCERLQTHLDAYGHIIYDLDFAKLLPLDDPTPMLETIKMYLRGAGTNPHERQRAAEEKREQSAASMHNRLKGLRRWAFDKTLRIGQTMAQVRENALADIGLGYPALRAMLRELGRRFVNAGVIEEAEDIFWLQADQVRDAITALERGEPPAALAGDVVQRKARHAVLRRATPPPMLPPKKKYMGIDMEAWTPAAEESQVGGTLKGIGASAGQVTAPARVLRGPEDFAQMRPGDVLVAATTTPAWTPLFAMASAVVTDIGGPLSHGSIVAREYGIPAVMGTGVATKRIHSGQTITVDGGVGVVTL